MRKVAVLLSAVGVSVVGVMFACSSKDNTLPDLPRNDSGTFDVVQETNPGDGNVMGSAAEFCKGTLGAYAALVDRCCTTTDKALPQGMELTSHASSLVSACITALEGGMAKSRTMYQQGQAQACLMDYAMKFSDMSLCGTLQQIDPTAEPNPMCAQAFVGLGANNALCSADHECKDGLTCVGYSGSNDGTCRTPAGAGGACGSLRKDGTLGALVIPMGSHPACAAGFYCDETANCKAQVGPGSVCTRNDQCNSPSRCDGTGHCTATADNALKTMGLPCTTSVDCTVDLFCDHANTDGGSIGMCAGKKQSPDMCVLSDTGECSGLCTAGQCVGFCGAT